MTFAVTPQFVRGAIESDALAVAVPAQKALDMATALIERGGRAAPQPMFDRVLNRIKGGEDPGRANLELMIARNALADSGAALEHLGQTGQVYDLPALADETYEAITAARKAAVDLRQTGEMGTPERNIAYAQAITEQAEAAITLGNSMRKALIKGTLNSPTPA